MALGKWKARLLRWGDYLANGVLLAAGLFAAYVLALVFLVASFRVPSDSMEPALVPGDNILVDKCATGARLFNVWQASEHKEVSIRRLPGWRDFRRGDVLVFNFPYPGRWDSIAFDVRTYYVKRCIAVPGDTLDISRAHYRIRGLSAPVGNVKAQDRLQQLVGRGAAEQCGIVLKAYPNRSELPWSIVEFGPLYVPCRGSRIPLDARNALLYANPIKWEQGKPLTARGDSVWIGDSLVTEYCFRENYYFVSGDYMENSRDSRYWGLLPEPYIVGRAWLIWKSVDPFTKKVRWDRVMKRVE